MCRIKLNFCTLWNLWYNIIYIILCVCTWTNIQSHGYESYQFHYQRLNPTKYITVCCLLWVCLSRMPISILISLLRLLGLITLNHVTLYTSTETKRLLPPFTVMVPRTRLLRHKKGTCLLSPGLTQAQLGPLCRHIYMWACLI